MTDQTLAQPDTATGHHAAHSHHHRKSHAQTAKGLLPGLLLTGGLAAVAFGIQHMLPPHTVLSPLIIAIVLGIAFHNTIGTPARCKSGVTFSLKRILRFAIILLGLQLTVLQIAAVGGRGLLIVALSLGATFLFTVWLGKRIGVDSKLATLIAAGTSICGASAVIAANTVTDAPDEDVAYAVACVTVFGSLAMLIYPLVQGHLHLPAHAYGLWAGASIHEVAQVVAAAFQGGHEAGDFGTIAKLSRVAMLAPVILLMGYAVSRKAKAHGHGHGHRAKAPIPWFVIGFIAMILFNSLGVLPEGARHDLVQVTTFLLTMALAAMGLETDIRKLRAKGLRPLALGTAAALFISLLSFSLIHVVF